MPYVKEAALQREIAVSSYSVRQFLGPIRMSFRGPDGQKQPFVWEQPQTMTLLEFPCAVKEHLGLGSVEICQFHLPERTTAYVAELKHALSSAGVQLSTKAPRATHGSRRAARLGWFRRHSATVNPENRW